MKSDEKCIVAITTWFSTLYPNLGETQTQSIFACPTPSFNSMQALGETIQWFLRFIPQSTYPSLDILGGPYDISTTAGLNLLILAAKTWWRLAFWEAHWIEYSFKGEWSRSPKRLADGHVKQESEIQASGYVCSIFQYVHLSPGKHHPHLSIARYSCFQFSG